MSELNFNNGKDEPSKVEIILQIRDKNGNPTGKTSTFDGNSRDAGHWYSKQSTRKKKRRRKKKEPKK